MAHSSRTWRGARTPQAMKRVRQDVRKQAVNRPHRSRTKTLVIKAVSAAQTGDAAEAQTALVAAVSALDRAAKSGAIHPNAAARRKSRLTLKVNAALGGEAIVGAAKAGRSTGKAAAAKAAKARVAASKAAKAKGEQTAAGKARAALSRSTRAEAAQEPAAAAAPIEHAEGFGRQGRVARRLPLRRRLPPRPRPRQPVRRHPPRPAARKAAAARQGPRQGRGQDPPRRHGKAGGQDGRGEGEARPQGQDDQVARRERAAPRPDRPLGPILSGTSRVVLCIAGGHRGPPEPDR